MAIEIVDFPIKNGDFPWQNVNVHQRVAQPFYTSNKDNNDF